MKSFIATVRKKAWAIKQIIGARKIASSIPLAPDNEARATISSVLRSRLKPQTAEQDSSLNAIADEILCAIKTPPETPLHKRAEQLADGILEQAFWYHGQLAGLTTIWEFRVRILGNKLGIRPNVPIAEKSKKNRSNKSVEHRSLKDTIKEINKACGNRLTLKLLDLCDLRDSIVHCNPHGIRAYATQYFGKNILKPLRGNVVVFSIPKGAPRNLSDVQDELEAEEQDVVGWFLEVFNSGLPKKTFAAFEDSIKAIDLLILFHAISFDDRSGTFQRVVLNGARPTEEEIAKFRDYFSQHHTRYKMNADQFFQRISSFIKLTP